MFIAQNGKTEVDGGDGDGDEAGVAAVSAPLPPMRSGTGDQTLTNTGEKGVAVPMMGNITGVGHLLVAIVSRGEGGDAEDMDQTDQSPTTVMDDPLLTMGPTHSLHPRRRTPRTQHRLSPLRHRTRNLPQPLLLHLYLGLHQ